MFKCFTAVTMSFFDSLFKRLKRPRSGVLSGADREFIKQEWLEIEQLLELGDPSGRKEALIRADKVLDLALKKISVGNTMGERLKNTQKNFSSYSIYDGLWKAHKMRNALVHEAGFEPPHYIIKTAIEQIKAGLIDLKVLTLN